ncbi:MAG TPA: hypothetical protein VE136_15395 [Anaerolineales bacterium]|nr:hypothetical protein [Anaerolineales bacterium]
MPKEVPTTTSAEKSARGRQLCRVGGVDDDESVTSLLYPGKAIPKAAACHFMEEDEQPVDFEGQRLVSAINPYQVRTFRVRFEW